MGQVIFIFLAILISFFLTFPFFSVLFSRFRKAPSADPEVPSIDFACIITAYKNVEITIPGVKAMLEQPYASIRVYLVADACEPMAYPVEDARLTILWPDPPLNLKAKSIIYAMDHYVRPHKYTVVFDADNLVHPDFFFKMAAAIHPDRVAVQGQRTAKNLDTYYACADATGEFYKNYIERYIPPLLGSSAVISGSGMAVESTVYRDYLNSPEIQEGKEKWKKMLQEDKILQNFLVGKNNRIFFARDAIVYDEKVATGKQVETQRSRWLYSYFQNIPNVLRLLGKGLLRGSVNQLYFGLITISPPLFILLFSALALSLLGLWINPVFSVVLFASIFIFICNIFLTLYLSRVPKAIWRSIWGIPLFVWKQFRALFKMSNPNKNFQHTEHSKKYSLDDVLKKEE